MASKKARLEGLPTLMELEALTAAGAAIPIMIVERQSVQELVDRGRAMEVSSCVKRHM